MYKNIFIYNNIKLDAPTPWGLFFQDSATPQMEGIEELHNNIMFYLAIILFTVTWIMITIIRSFVSTKSLITHNVMINMPRDYESSVVRTVHVYRALSLDSHSMIHLDSTTVLT